MSFLGVELQLSFQIPYTGVDMICGSTNVDVQMRIFTESSL